jgi:hypothetical protein
MLESPNKFSFKVYLPNFIPAPVTEMFDSYLFAEQTLPFTKTMDLFNAQVKGYELPDLSLKSVAQVGADGERTQLQSRTMHEVFGSKQVEVEIRSIAGYLNYHIARYAYYLYATPKLNDELNATGTTIGDLTVIINSTTAFMKYKMIYKNVVWLGVTGKKFEYDTTQEQPDSFVLAFEHNGFVIEPILRNDILKSKGLL